MRNLQTVSEMKKRASYIQNLQIIPLKKQSRELEQILSRLPPPDF